MAKMSVEIEGSVDEVIGVLRRLETAGREATGGYTDRSIERPGDGVRETTPATGTQGMAVAHEASPGEWTETLARDFLSDLQPAARRMTLQVWRAGAACIHRSALCQRAELTPMELRTLTMRMGRALARFQRERGMTLARPVAANSPLQSYCVAPDFAAVAKDRMFGDGMPDGLVNGGGPPDGFRLLGAGESPRALLRTPLAMLVLLLIALACGMNVDDRMVRRYAECMVDSNTMLHRLTVSESVGTVLMNADAVEERLHAGLSRGEITMAEIRADYGRYCE